ncbi:MAG: flagellar motor protein MotB [Opitutaceae bacterium]|nr:flagellar motor protein MotB [Opitutaceae bacterium]
MNNALKILSVILAGTALLLAGCTKKPVRPSPPQTMLQPSGAGITPPSDVSTFADPGTQLSARDPNIIEDENTIRGKLGAVYFDFDKSNIKEGERAKLQEAAKYLKDNSHHRLLLEGHCDWRGTAEYNLGLGDRRASAAKAYLGTLGVGADKVETLSKGSLDASKNADEAMMPKDRRAEIVILKK